MSSAGRCVSSRPGLGARGRARAAVCAALALALLFSLVSPAFAAPAKSTSGSSFPDVSPAQLSAYGLTNAMVLQLSDKRTGVPMRPTALVTRAEMISFLVKAFGIAPVYPMRPTFVDVPRSHPSYGYVEAAVRAGAIAPAADRKFYPQSTISHEAAISIFMGYLVKRNGRTLGDVMPDDAVTFQLGLFQDGGDVSPVCRKAVALAVARAAIKGTSSRGKHYLYPKSSVTRIEMMALVLKQRKPGISTLTPPVGGEHSFIGSTIEVIGDGIVHGLTTFGLDSVKDAIFGDKQWDEINGQLTDIQDGISDVEAGITQIEAELAALAQEYEIQSSQIKTMIEASAAQTAMNGIDSWYNATGVDNYAYYTSPARRFSRDASETVEGLINYQANALDPDHGLRTDLANINTAIVPTGASDAGVLTQWTNTLCVGDVTDEEMQDSYNSLESYYTTLIAHQMEAVQIIVDAKNAQDGGTPRSGFANCYEANEFLNESWYPMLKAENDDFFRNACRIAIYNARNRNDFMHSTDLLGDPAVAEIVKRADFLCSNYQEQAFVFALGTGKGDPNDAYGLHAISRYPTGLAPQTEQVTAHTDIPILNTYWTRYFVPVSALETSYPAVPTGAKTLVFNGSQAPWTCDLVDTYTVRRLQFSPGVFEYPGNEFSFDGLPGQSSVTLARVDTSNNPTSDTGPGSRLYGCSVGAYQYDGRPAPLQQFALTKTTTNSFMAGYPDISPGYASANLNRKFSLGWQIGWDLRTESTPFQWIGPDNTSVSWTLCSGDGNGTGPSLVHAWHSYPWADSWSWNCGLGVSDGAGKILYSYDPSKKVAVAGKATPISSDLTSSEATLAVTMQKGQTYSSYLTNNGAWKCTLGTVSPYALSIGNQVKVDHFRIGLNE